MYCCRKLNGYQPFSPSRAKSSGCGVIVSPLTESVILPLWMSARRRIPSGPQATCRLLTSWRGVGSKYADRRMSRSPVFSQTDTFQSFVAPTTRSILRTGILCPYSSDGAPR